MEYVLAFLKALPVLWALYGRLKELFGDNPEKFLVHILETEKMVKDSLKEGLSDEEKRKLRIEALQRSAAEWSGKL